MELPMFGLKSRGARNWLLAAILFGTSILFTNIIHSVVCLIASGLLCDVLTMLILGSSMFFAAPVSLILVLALEYTARKRLGTESALPVTAQTEPANFPPLEPSRAKRNGLILLFALVALASVSNYENIRSTLTPQADYRALFATFDLRNTSPDGTRRAYIDHGSFEQIPSTLVVVGDIPGAPQFPPRVVFSGDEKPGNILTLSDFYWVDNETLLVRATHASKEKQVFIQHVLVSLIPGIGPRILLDQPDLSSGYGDGGQLRNPRIVFSPDRKHFIATNESIGSDISTGWLIDITSGASSLIAYRAAAGERPRGSTTIDPVSFDSNNITLLRSEYDLDDTGPAILHNPPLKATLFRSTTAPIGSSYQNIVAANLIEPMLVSASTWTFEPIANYLLHKDQIIFLDPVVNTTCTAPDSIAFTIYDQTTGAIQNVSARLDRSIVVTQPSFVFGCRADLQLVATDRGSGPVRKLLLQDTQAGELLVADLDQKTIVHVGKGFFIDSMYSAVINR